MKIIDTRGKACPAPLIMTKKAIKEASTGDKLEILSDNDTATCNLRDYLNELKVSFSETKDNNISTITVTVPEETDSNVSAESFCRTTSSGDYAVVIKSDKMGTGDDELGAILLRAFINSLAESEKLPTSIILYNSGVKTALKNTDTALSLQKLEERGVTIIACGTCLEFFNVKERLAVGVISNMYKITELVSSAGHVVYP